MVGSSAMSSRGGAAMAMAPTTRWRMPPESWCGNAREPRGGRGDAHGGEQRGGALGQRLAAQAVVHAGGLAHLHADRRTPGSASSSGPAGSSRPARPRICCISLLALGEQIVAVEEDLPAEDARRRPRDEAHDARGTSCSCPSPTRRRGPSVSPSPTLKDTPSTALIVPQRVTMWVRRSRTSMTGRRTRRGRALRAGAASGRGCRAASRRAG